MQVVTANAPATVIHRGEKHYFCSDRCAERFVADPGRYADRVAATSAATANDNSTR
jgi:YHS domain-containing protein